MKELKTLEKLLSLMKEYEGLGLELDESSNEQPTNGYPEIKNGDRVMAFLKNGFIFVGDFYVYGNKCMLKNNVLNCRYQDQGKGWGYIAEQGKESCTVDNYGDMSFHEYQIVFLVPVDRKKW